MWRVKYIRFYKATVPVICQDANGPCPLIALANVISLLNRPGLRLAPDATTITVDELLSAVASYALARPAPTDAAAHASHEFQLNEALETLPQLLRGIDLNPRFAQPRFGRAGVLERAPMESADVVRDMFEFTKESGLYDVIDVRLIHAWCVDPDEGHAVLDAITGLSYNTARELQVVASCSGGGEEGSSGSGGGGSVSGRASVSASGCESGAAAIESRSTSLDRARIVDRWLSSTPFQATPFGVRLCTAVLREAELCCLFRNDHLSVIFKNGGRLYSLVTDVGYADEPRVVWQSLDPTWAACVQNDTAFYDADFRPLVPPGSAEQSAPSASMASSSRSREEDDFARALAESMQTASLTSTSGGGGEGTAGGRRGFSPASSCCFDDIENVAFRAGGCSPP